MPTTTIRLSEELKARIADAAERSGTTAHAFILDAIAERVSDEERRDEFHQTAEQRYAQIVASGKTLPWSQVQTYLKRRLTNEKPTRPKGKKLAR